MSSDPLHLHSMMVHAVIALSVVAAAGFVLAATGVVVAGLGADVWLLLVRGSLVGLLAIGLPASLSGITKRNRMYVNWHSSQRAKLVLSLVLVALAGWELAAVLQPSVQWVLASPLALGVVVLNPVVVVLLSSYGLRITLGRQGLGATSYVPDMCREPPVDILALVAERAAEEPRLIDVLEERA